MENKKESLKIKREYFHLVPVSQIQVEEGFNARIDYGDIESLVSSIIEHGVKQPVTGRKEGDTFVLTDGHRRFKAVQIAIERGHDIKTIKMVVEKKGYNEEQRLVDMITLNSRKNLSMVEKGDVYKRLIGYGWSETKIAQSIGMSESHVSGCLTLVNSASQKLKKAVADKVLAPSSAIEIARSTSSSKEQDKMVKELLTESGPKKGKGAKVSRTSVIKKVKAKKESDKGNSASKKPKAPKPTRTPMELLVSLNRGVSEMTNVDVKKKEVLEEIIKYAGGRSSLEDTLSIFEVY